MKLLLPYLFLLFSFVGITQNFEQNWTGYFSYVSIKAISQGNDRIYAASENAVFSYDLSTQEIKTISTINGLSGNLISTLYYSENFNLIVVGFESGLIQIIQDGGENVLSVVDILNKPTIPPDKKRINQFNEYNGNLYIATQYGISVYNLALLEFGDTYFIGDGGQQINISQTAVNETFIYASTTEDGLRRANVDDDNLIDFRQWQLVGDGGYSGVQTLDNQVYVLDFFNNALRFNAPFNFTTVATFESAVNNFVTKNNITTVTTNNGSKVFGSNFTLLAQVNSIIGFQDLIFQSGFAFNNVLYLGSQNQGMLAVPFGQNQATQILPDGPIRNDPFALDASPGQLWVSFGEVNVDYNPFFPNGILSKRGISNLREGEWTNISYEDLVAQVGGQPTDFVKIKINPNNTEEVYMSSYNGGLLKVENQIPSTLFNETNSPLTRVLIGTAQSDAGIRLYGSDYDRQGNLWIVQSRLNEGLIKYTPAGQFQFIDMSDVIDNVQNIGLGPLAISREGNVFYGSYSEGLIGYNSQTGAFNSIKGLEIGSGNLSNANIRALVFDAQNRLWIGSLSGLRILNGSGSFFEENANTDASSIIIIENGVAQELLFEQSITKIVVDGSNNKWIATATSGVFYLSSNGQETLLRFDKDNSPLPSNNVQDIAIDGFTGAVYFATANGLVAYNGSSTAPNDTLENVYVFPNPVRPGFNGNVQIDGLTAKANVKITDIEGNLVFETTSQGGSVLWDTMAFGRYKVASGVYLVLITTEDAIETKIAKVMIVR